MPSSLPRDSAARTIFVCCSSGSEAITLSRRAASQTAVSVSSRPCTTLVWRTSSRIGQLVLFVPRELPRVVVHNNPGRCPDLLEESASSRNPRCPSHKAAHVSVVRSQVNVWAYEFQEPHPTTLAWCRDRPLEAAS
jgi:hypothetical protein